MRRPPGRPRFGKEALQKRNVMLSNRNVEAARYLGDTNMSKGVRIALDFAMREQERYEAYLAERRQGK